MVLRKRIGIVGAIFGFLAVTAAMAGPMKYILVNDSGQVGIGTQTPAGMLDVEGSGGVILNAGNVGIGTAKPTTALDAHNGEIRVGSSGKPCTAEIAGAIRYADKNLQFCNGKGWQILQSISPGDRP
jgi:hypothetical protein